jgi:hypothetical protein
VKAPTLRRLGTLLILAAALSGCAAIERQEAALGEQQAADTEKLLAAAGFRMIPADSAERQHDLATLPPRRIVTHRRGARTVYVYADPQSCRCLYVGAPGAYAKYLQLEVSEDIAGDTSTESEYSSPASFPSWAAWRPQWDPDEPGDRLWTPDDF